MSNRIFLFHLLLTILTSHYASTHSTNANQLIFNGFSDTDLRLDGQASIRSHAIRLTQGDPSVEGGAFYNKPLNFKSDSSFGVGGASFSTTFVFIVTANATADLLEAYGISFVLSSTMELHHQNSHSSGQNIGTPSMGGKDTNFGDQILFSVELNGIDINHVEIDVKSLVSVDSRITNLYRSNSRFQSTELTSQKPMQVWMDYNGKVQILNITLEEFGRSQVSRPQSLPQFSSSINLSSLLSDSDLLYAGFSASGQFGCNHYVLGWSFMVNGEAPLLNSFAMHQVLASLPVENEHKQQKQEQEDHNSLHVFVPAAILGTVAFFVLVVLVVLVYCNVKSWMKENFGLETCEIEWGLPPFTYRDLFTATGGFSKKMILGKGGFGKVYKGILAVSKQNIAVKRVSPESKQGMKEFITEIVILGKLRHRNLVQLIGYCHHRQELLLVYDYMSNGSLDMHLYCRNKPTIDWAQRLHTIKGVASGLLYLHEDWEQVVIHRDIKTSNVLFDDEMNGRLGDFGLARLHSHESDAHTTRVAGTWGYIAPELAKLGKATKATDVYAFGVLMLEVVCGKRPIEVKADGEILLLSDWVLNAWQSGSIVDAIDARLEEEYTIKEAELVLKLGLICSHSLPKKRPCMPSVMQYLEQDAPLPDFLPSFLSVDMSNEEDFIAQVSSYPSVATSITGISGGR